MCRPWITYYLKTSIHQRINNDAYNSSQLIPQPFSGGKFKGKKSKVVAKSGGVKSSVCGGFRDLPVRNSSGVVKIDEDGNLVLLDEVRKSVWSTNHLQNDPDPENLLETVETGNSVLRLENDPDPENDLWQSFDYPTDTLLSFF
ncbi:protein serine/threonine kinase [Abeliophyllum distichum]|uniref:Protein serine/threonine kinase n=1 Tax=Abeliophyllum distichum TaxID=126358 RepID=A0ABD1Q7W0_9LAMI